MDKYVHSVRSVARVFKNFQCQVDTLAEHHKYAVWFSKWSELGGAGAFCEVDMKKSPGDAGFLKPVKLASGAVRRPPAEMLVGMLRRHAARDVHR